MATALTERELQLWLAFLRAAVTISRQLDDAMRCEDGVPLGWYDVLIHLYHGPGTGQRMQELAEHVIMSSSGLTRLLDHMVAQGLVTRAPDADDRRVVLARLTDDGRALVETLLPRHQARVRELFIDHLSDSEIAVMLPALERVLAAITDDPSADSPPDSHTA